MTATFKVTEFYVKFPTNLYNVNVGMYVSHSVQTEQTSREGKKNKNKNTPLLSVDQIHGVCGPFRVLFVKDRT